MMGQVEVYLAAVGLSLRERLEKREGEQMRTFNVVLTSLGLSLVLGLFGCGSGSSEPTSPAKTEEAPAEEAADSDESAAQSEVGSFKKMKLAGSAYHYELENVGSFAGERYDVQVQYKGAIGFDGDDAQLIGLDGKPMLDGQAIAGIEYLANGIYMVALDSEEMNNVGLVSLSDGLLIPCETAKVVTKTEDPADARFLEVIYATEETDNQDEAFIYSTDAMISFKPEEGDILYKGYAKVFDLEKRAFVDGVQIDNASPTAMKDLGDAFVVEGTDGTYTMYDARGKELWSSSGYPSVNSHTLSVSDGGAYTIIDATGKASFTSSEPIGQFTNADDLYTISGSDAERVIDSTGNLVLKDPQEDVIGEYGGLFVVKEGDTTKIIDSKGKVFADDVEEFTVNQRLPGILSYKNLDGKQALCFTDGRIVEIGDNYASDLVCKDGEDNYLVLSKGDFSLKLASTETLGIGLISGRSDASLSTRGLYDLFTGEMLLDESYESIDWAGGYIYAFKEGTWSVYEAKLVQE